MVYDDLDVTEYVNGRVARQFSLPEPRRYAQYCQIGKFQPNPHNAYEGIIDKLMIFDYPLSKAEIQEQYTQGFNRTFTP